METKAFHIGDVLTVTTGCLLSPRGMRGLHEILRWMTGEPIFTPQIPRCIREAAPVILAMHPQLAVFALDDDLGVTPETIDAFLAAQIARFGETLPIPKLNADQHERIDPLSELAERIHPDRIRIVTTE